VNFGPSSTSKERLKVLKADDEEAYMKLIDTAKDTCITHLLQQTDAYLDSLAHRTLNSLSRHPRSPAVRRVGNQALTMVMTVFLSPLHSAIVDAFQPPSICVSFRFHPHIDRKTLTLVVHV
jgi:hypothetical protein